jgi:hypothetical protein
MRILVIEDSPANQQSARDTLSEHELTIVGSYDEAMKILQGKQKFDVVFTDLMMPAGMAGVNGDGKKWEGTLMPMGFGLLLLAVIVSGAKYVGLVSDPSRHDHPVGNQIEVLMYSDFPQFLMNGVVVGIYSKRFCNFMYQELEEGSKYSYKLDTPKHWGNILANLLQRRK